MRRGGVSGRVDRRFISPVSIVLSSTIGQPAVAKEYGHLASHSVPMHGLSPRLSFLFVIMLCVNGLAPIHHRFHSTVCISHTAANANVLML